MLPLNILSEVTRTFSLMVRLFGNVMSGEFVIALVVALAGLFVPIPLMVLEILVGIVQAYIFTVLATVFIGAAVGSGQGRIKEVSWTPRLISHYLRGHRRLDRFDRSGTGGGPCGRRSDGRHRTSARGGGTISRTLFVGLAMIETMAIYCLVVALLLLFANPYTG